MYYLRFKSPETNKTAYKSLGHLMEISLAEARKRAVAEKAALKINGDPRGAKKVKSGSITVTDLFEKHLFPHTLSRKRSHSRDKEMYDLRIKKAFGSKRLCDMTRREVQVFHTQLLEEKLAPATCDHYVKLMRAAFNHAVRWELMEKNPLSGIRLYSVDNRIENVPDQESLGRLLKILQTDKNRPVCLIALYLLATGARLSEALNAKWAMTDRENRVWRIPASTSKSKRIRSVPLSDAAMDVINQLQTEGKYDYLFVNVETGKPYTNIHKAWHRMRLKAGLPTLRLHDLRHCNASWMVSSGISLFVVQEILGHSDPKVTMRYSHVANQTKLDASNTASAIIKASMPVAVDASPEAKASSEVPA